MEAIKKEKADAQIEWKHCDMGNLNEVKSVFSEIRESLDRLDFLVLSAGINTNQYGTEGLKFWTKVKTVTQRWPDGGGDGSNAFVIPTMG